VDPLLLLPDVEPQNEHEGDGLHVGVAVHLPCSCADQLIPGDLFKGRSHQILQFKCLTSYRSCVNSLKIICNAVFCKYFLLYANELFFPSSNISRPYLYLENNYMLYDYDTA
jgi:hypothetical protein